MEERLTGRKILKELLAQFNLERGLLRTFVDLIICPGKMLIGYLDGSMRTKYVRVLNYLFLAIAISVTAQLLYDPTAEWIAEQRAQLEVTSPSFSATDSQQYDSDDLDEIAFLNTYAQIYHYAVIPLWSVFSLLIFRYWRMNYVEHIVICTFLVSQAVIFTAPLPLLLSRFTEIEPQSIEDIELLVAMPYMIFGQVLLSDQLVTKRRIRSAFCSTLSLALSLFVMVLLISEILSAYRHMTTFS